MERRCVAAAVNYDSERGEGVYEEMETHFEGLPTASTVRIYLQPALYVFLNVSQALNAVDKNIVFPW